MDGFPAQELGSCLERFAEDVPLVHAWRRRESSCRVTAATWLKHRVPIHGLIRNLSITSTDTQPWWCPWWNGPCRLCLVDLNRHAVQLYPGGPGHRTHAEATSAWRSSGEVPLFMLGCKCSPGISGGFLSRTARIIMQGLSQ